MKKFGLTIFILFIFIISFSKTSNVLILHSYHSSFTWVDAVNKGMFSELKKDTDINLYIEYMDTKRKSYDEQYHVMQHYLEEKYKDKINIDLIISLDDNAFRFLLAERNKIFGNVPVIFGGVNDENIYDFDKLNNYKGIIENIDIKSTIESIKHIYPKTDKIYFINDNKTTTSDILKNRIEKIKSSFPNIEFVYLEDLVINELLAKVSNLSDNEQIYLLMYNKDKLGNFYNLESIAEMIAKEANRPVFTSWDFYFDYDILGGMVTQGTVHGENIAKMALNTINDNNYYDRLPKYSYSDKSFVFNDLVMKKYGIKKSDLPEGSIVINEKPNFYEKYTAYVWSFIIIIVVILTYAIILRKKLHERTELLHTISEQKNELSASNEEITAMNEELETQNEELESLYKNLEEKNEELANLISIVTDIDKQYITNEEYYSKLIQTAIKIIPNADYGSVSIGYDSKWEFISAVGHDLDKLKAIPLKKNYMVNSKEIVIYDIISENKSKLPPEIEKQVTEATKPIKQSMITTITLPEGKRLNFALDVDKNNYGTFNRDSIEIFRAFTKLAENFIKNKMDIDRTRNAYINFASKLAVIAEAHDDATGKHIFRVGELAAFIARKLNLSDEQIFNVKTFAPLHDIGKIFIPNNILNKPGKLNEAEWELMKKHTIFADKILDDPYFETARKIAVYHHEKYDGSGYPYGIKGDKIPIEAQIVAIVDVYDALRSKRSYKKALTHEEALDIITKGDEKTKPEHFRKDLIDILVKNQYQIEKIFNFII